MYQTVTTFFFITTFLCLNLFGQSVDEKQSYYLVDSIDISALGEVDQQIVEKALNLYYACDNDTCKVNAISTIVEESWDDTVWPRYNQWIYHFTRSSLKKKNDSSTQIHLQKAYSGALNNIGFYYSSVGRTDLALDYYDSCIFIQRFLNDQEGISGTLVNIGYIYLNQGLIEKALEYYYESLSIQEKLGNQEGIATAWNGIGYMQYQQNENQKALSSYRKSLDIREELQNEYGIATCLNNIGLVLKEEGKWVEALDYFNRCLDIQSKLSDRSGMAISLANVGFIYINLKRYEKAREYYQKSLDIRRKLEDKSGISQCLNSLAEIGLITGDSQSAEKNALTGLKLAVELDFPIYIRDAAKTLTQIYKAKGAYREALEYHELYTQMRDSIFNKETLTASIHNQYQYDYNKKALTDSISNAEAQKVADAQLLASQAEAKRLSFQLTLAVIAGGIVMVLVILLAFSMFNVRRKQKVIKQRNADIRAQKENLEVLNQELKQFAHTVSHDLKTPLAGIQGLIHIIEDEYPQMEKELRGYFSMIKESSAKGIQLINGILSYAEAGKQVDFKRNLDVFSIVRGIADNTNSNTGIQIEISDEKPYIDGNPTQIQQIFANLISNAIKYNDKGDAGWVKIDYRRDHQFHEFSISDNGLGIPENQHEAIFDIFKKAHAHSNDIDSTGVGLSIVQKLINQNGGNIRVESKVGEGSTFIFTWPAAQMQRVA